MSYGATPNTGESIEQIKQRLAEKSASEQAQLDVWKQHNAALLEAAQQRKEAEEAEKLQKLQELREQNFDREHKDRARRQWLMSGGTAQGFDEAWPSLKQEFLQQTVMHDLEAAKVNASSMYRDL